MRLVWALKRRLSERRERHWREQRALTERLTRLINGVRDRLDDRLFESVLEYAGQTEWEIAIDVIRTEMRDGRLALGAAEVAELEAIEQSPFLTRSFLPPESRPTSPAPHSSLGKNTTPAMAAGVSDHVWTLQEIAGLLD